MDFRQNSALLERAILAVILPGVAGAINASGFFAVGAYTSHVTGAVARVGDELASGHLWLAARSLLFVASFFLGALACTLLIPTAAGTGPRRTGARSCSRPRWCSSSPPSTSAPPTART